jgi:hypothetical protein
MFHGYSCAPGCNDMSVGNTICDPACNMTDCMWDGGDCGYSGGYAFADNCATACPVPWIEDGFCDEACFNEACGWDGDDCLLDSASCASGCLPNWIGDRECDAPCNNEACGWDGHDCDHGKAKPETIAWLVCCLHPRDVRFPPMNTNQDTPTHIAISHRCARPCPQVGCAVLGALVGLLVLRTALNKCKRKEVKQILETAMVSPLSISQVYAHRDLLTAQACSATIAAMAAGASSARACTAAENAA